MSTAQATADPDAFAWSRAEALVRSHGWNATAAQTLARGYRYFFDGEDACVAYVDTGAAWVAAGAPIASADRLDAVARAFVAAARAAGRRACFFATEARFAEASRPALRSIAIAEQPEWDVAAWDATLRGHRSLREQLRRARAKGVTVRRVSAAELAAPGPLRDGVERVREAWLATRSMAPMEFLVAIHLFDRRIDRAFLIAERGGRVIAVGSLVPVPARNGWFLEHLLRTGEAPNGTFETMVDASMRHALEAGGGWVTLGMAPLAGAVPRPLAVARRLGRPLYHFEGIRAARARLHPARWSPIYLSLPSEQGAIATFRDVLTAFAGGSLVRYGARTIMTKRGIGGVALVLGAGAAAAIAGATGAPALLTGSIAATSAALLAFVGFAARRRG
jgi:phosphatidylglycerol lysyltransferase